MYANRKGWDVGQLAVEVDYEPDSKGQCPRFDVVMRLPDTLSDEQLERIRAVAARCPVHQALTGDVQVNDRVERLSASAP